MYRAWQILLSTDSAILMETWLTSHPSLPGYVICSSEMVQIKLNNEFFLFFTVTIKST